MTKFDQTELLLKSKYGSQAQQNVAAFLMEVLPGMDSGDLISSPIEKSCLNRDKGTDRTAEILKAKYSTAPAAKETHVDEEVFKSAESVTTFNAWLEKHADTLAVYDDEARAGIIARAKGIYTKALLERYTGAKA